MEQKKKEIYVLYENDAELKRYDMNTKKKI